MAVLHGLALGAHTADDRGRLPLAVLADNMLMAHAFVAFRLTTALCGGAYSNTQVIDGSGLLV